MTNPKLRAFYTPDILTPDWPIYFYTREKHNKWEMDKDPSYTYDFYFPFFYSDWIIQKRDEEGTWTTILETKEDVNGQECVCGSSSKSV